MNIVTTETVDGRAHKVVGLVEANSTRTASVVRDLFASIRDFFGGKTRSYDQMISDLNDDVFGEIEAKAKAMGADAIVGLRTQMVPLGVSAMVSMQVVGTAVKLGG